MPETLSETTDAPDESPSVPKPLSIFSRSPLPGDEFILALKREPMAVRFVRIEDTDYPETSPYHADAGWANIWVVENVETGKQFDIGSKERPLHAVRISFMARCHYTKRADGGILTIWGDRLGIARVKSNGRIHYLRQRYDGWSAECGSVSEDSYASRRYGGLKVPVPTPIYLSEEEAIADGRLCHYCFPDAVKGNGKGKGGEVLPIANLFDEVQADV